LSPRNQVDTFKWNKSLSRAERAGTGCSMSRLAAKDSRREAGTKNAAGGKSSTSLPEEFS
jgi:hypothetical protein